MLQSDEDNCNFFNSNENKLPVMQGAKIKGEGITDGIKKSEF